MTALGRLAAALLAVTTALGGSEHSGVPLQSLLDAAQPGETVRVPAGTHQGNLRITRPVHLVGEPGAILQGDGTGYVIHGLAAGVTVEGLEIRGSGTDLSADHAGIRIEGDDAVIRDNTLRDVLHGIYVKGAFRAVIERNTILGWSTVPMVESENGDLCSTGTDKRGNGIHLWNSAHNVIRRNFVTGMRDGIYLSFARESLIAENYATTCRYGLHYMYSDSNEIADNVFRENAAGAALMFSKNLTIRGNQFSDHSGQRAGGVVLHSVDYSQIAENLIRNNRAGLYFQNCNGNTFTRNRVVKNYIGMRLTGSSLSNVFLENTNRGNLHNVDLAGNDLSNRWDDGKRGNYWQNSASPDLDGDGVGEWPHREADILGPHRHDFPLVGLLSASPFVQAVQFAFQRAPVPGLPVIRDNRPLRREATP